MPPVRKMLPILLAALTAPLVVRAQSGQEKIVQEKLERSGTLEYVPAGKAFSADASSGAVARRCVRLRSEAARRTRKRVTALSTRARTTTAGELPHGKLHGKAGIDG